MCYQMMLFALRLLVYSNFPLSKSYLSFIHLYIYVCFINKLTLHFMFVFELCDCNDCVVGTSVDSDDVASSEATCD